MKRIELQARVGTVDTILRRTPTPKP
jgi:hypothetical protein